MGDRKTNDADMSNDVMKRESLQILRSRIFEYRHALMSFYVQMDEQESGYVSVSVWEQGLSCVLSLPDIPWRKILPYIATLELQNLVQYPRFLRRYHIRVSPTFQSEWTQKVTRKCCQKFLSQNLSVSSAFETFDTNSDGRISYDELVQRLRAMDLGLSDGQLFDLMGHIDVDRNGFIDADEFVNAFTLTYTKEKAEGEEEEAWSAKRQYALYRDVIFEKQVRLRDLLKRGKENKHERVSAKELKKVLKRLGGERKLSGEQMEEMVSFAMKKERERKRKRERERGEEGEEGEGEGEESISYRRFRHLLSPRYDSPSWQDDVIQQVTSLLFQAKVHLRRLFASFDCDGNGYVDQEEFRRGMEMFNESLNCPLSSHQISCLQKVFDSDGDGRIKYDEFFETLSVLDAEEGGE